jgi:hypothetical protein
LSLAKPSTSQAARPSQLRGDAATNGVVAERSTIKLLSRILGD